MRGAYPPDFPPRLAALMREAELASRTGDLARAEPLFRQIVALNPRDPDAWHMLAIIGLRSARPADALEAATRAHGLEKRNHHYLNTLGVAHAELGQLDEAGRAFARALKERPAHAESHYNLGKLHERRGALPEAERSYGRARQLDPRRGDVANNLGCLYSRLGRYEEALGLLADARSALPDDADIAVNYAIATLGSSGPVAAIAALKAFLDAHPQAAAAHAELGRRLLAHGELAEGWRHYAWRRGAPGGDPNLDGKRVLLLPDQGLGDHLFFLRFAPYVRRRAAHVAFKCEPRMRALLAHANPVDDLCEHGCEEASFDLALPLGDVPRLVAPGQTPPPLPLGVDDARVRAWSARLADFGPAPYLGVTWRAGSTRANAAEFARRGEDPLYKEIAIEQFAPALRAWRGTVVILQRAPAHGECDQFARAIGRRVHDLSACNDDLADMTAVLATIDEYVGVSNTNMHLRAGGNKAARVLVPFPPEFRWMDTGDRSPWFPAFPVYRQGADRSWASVLLRLSHDLTY